MKMPFTHLLLATTLLAANTALPADAAGDLAALKALEAEKPAWTVEGRTPTTSETFRWIGENSTRVAEAAIKFYDSHPDDPIRWEGALLALKTMRAFIIEYKPGIDEAAAAKDSARLQSLLVRDEAARAAWDARMDALESTLFSAGDVPDGVLGKAYVNAIYRVTLRRGASKEERSKAALSLLAAMEKRIADPSTLAAGYELASHLLATSDPATYDAMLARLSQSNMPEVSKWATGKANMLAARTKAIEMKFTAIDGREVDLAKLRGKVVLIDFWATWCGPCKEEIPNVRANYEKYHSKGFEVVAVSLDFDKDRQKLIDYCRDNQLPWPQHFDGKGTKNEYAMKYSIRAIPAMFLLDQEGRVVSSNARGEKLEEEIRRLLKI